MSAPRLTVVMRSKNDGPLIGDTLRGVYGQDYPGGVELVHIDSGSTDETVSVIRDTKPWKFIQIQAHEYVPGVVLNRGMREAQSDWVAFLNSDAQPANERWLSELMQVALSDSSIGTVFSRQIPRPDCQGVFAHDYDRCFGPQRESAQWPHFFSMVSCLVNRRAWEKFPFREDLQYAEDDEWSRRLRANGWKVLFAERSIAIHSHNYTWSQARKRAYGDSFAAAATVPEYRPRWQDWAYGVFFSTLRDAQRDWTWLQREKRLTEWPHAVGVRFMQRLGKTQGFRAGWKHYHRRPAQSKVP